VAQISRTSTFTALLPPTRSNSRSCSTRSSLAWKAGEMSPISSRNSVPPCAISKRPLRSPTAPVKAPFSWPKSSLSSSALGQRGAVDLDEGASLRGRQEVHGARDGLLAGAALAAQQHGGARRRGLVHLDEDLLHGLDSPITLSSAKRPRGSRCSAFCSRVVSCCRRWCSSRTAIVQLRGLREQLATMVRTALVVGQARAALHLALRGQRTDHRLIGLQRHHDEGHHAAVVGR
jgi:hypothetical protein